MNTYNPQQFQKMIDKRLQGSLFDFHLAMYMKNLSQKEYELAEQLLRINLGKNDYIRARTLAAYFRRERSEDALAARQ